MSSTNKINPISVSEILAKSHNNIGGEAAASHVYVWEYLLSCELGDVLELGGGYNSTPFISSRVLNYEMLTLESSAEWVEDIKKAQLHLGKNHRIEHVPDWDSYDWSKIVSKKWKYIFVDHSPGNHRIFEVARLLPYCEYMVIHDADADDGAGDYGWRRVRSLPRYWVEYNQYSPSTVVCSNFSDPTKLIKI